MSANLPAGPWIAIDIGDRRIGIARSDPTGTIATPLLVLPAAGRRTDIPAIVAILAREGAAGVVVGWPIRDDGVHTDQTAKAERFANRLRAVVSVPVILHDERFSSWEAGQRRRGATDADAAAVILEGFFAARRSAQYDMAEEQA